MWKPAAALPLESKQHTDLETLVRSGKTPQRVVLRALIVLAGADATLHTTPPDATQWSVRTMAKAQGLSHAVVHRI